MRIVSLSALFLIAAVSCAQVPQPRFSCQECVDEMHNLGRLVRAGGRAIEVLGLCLSLLVFILHIFFFLAILERGILSHP